MRKITAGRDVLGEFAPKFAQLNDDVLFGEVWSRESELSARDRSLITVTALMAQGLTDTSSGKYDKSSQFDAETDYRSVMPQFQPENIDRNHDLLTLLQKLAGQNNATPAQISLAWMLCKKPYLVPIPGTRRLSRLLENAGAADVMLSAEEVSVIDEALNDMEMSEVFGGSKIVSK